MSRGRLPKKNITHLFHEAEPAEVFAEEAPEGSRPRSTAASDPIPIPDPLGLVERLSGGRLYDPLRQTLVGFLKGNGPNETS